MCYFGGCWWWLWEIKVGRKRRAACWIVYFLMSRDSLCLLLMSWCGRTCTGPGTALDGAQGVWLEAALQTWETG